MSEARLPPHLDPRGRHRGGASVRWDAWRPLARVTASLVSIALLLLAGYTWYSFRGLNDHLTRLGGVKVGAAPDAKTADIDGKDQNILIVGNDDRSTMSDEETKTLHVGRDGGSLATDTMMIAHLPANGTRATLISLPRDTEVDIPDGYRRNKLNSPYASAYSDALVAGQTKNEARAAGANLLIRTISNLTGLTINHYVQVDLLGFYRITGAIGGVEVDMCKAVNDTRSANIARGLGPIATGLKLPQGKSVLTNLQALDFVRQRHGLPNGDFDRVKRQQYFLTAAFRKVATAGILLKLPQLSDALSRSLYLDPSLNILDLAKQLENLTANKIIGKTIPTSADGSANPKRVQAFVRRVIDSTNASASASNSSSPSTSKTSGPASPSTSNSPTAGADTKCVN